MKKYSDGSVRDLTNGYANKIIYWEGRLAMAKTSKDINKAESSLDFFKMKQAEHEKKVLKGFIEKL